MLSCHLTESVSIHLAASDSYYQKCSRTIKHMGMDVVAGRVLMQAAAAKPTEICPELTLFQRRVSAALRSRDMGDGRASLGGHGSPRCRLAGAQYPQLSLDNGGRGKAATV